MKIKVCGMTQLDQIKKLDTLGVDFVGFIFYAKSPRYVLNHLSETDIKKISGGFKKVGVFVNATEAEILEKVESCGLDMVQLHGDEGLLFCDKVAEKVPVIKAFRLLNNADVLYKIVPYREIVDYFLYDTNTESFGGSGKKFDWNILKDLPLEKQFFLSGGIGEDNIEDIHFFKQQNIAQKLFAIDINSRFEVSPGIKDLDRIAKFIQQLKEIK